MEEVRTSVRADYYQYYLLAVGAEFDASAVDAVNEGILAPARHGARVSTGVRQGLVELTVRVLDGPIPLPDPDAVVAAASNLDLSGGVVAVVNWGDARASFLHEFGQPLTLRSVGRGARPRCRARRSVRARAATS